MELAKEILASILAKEQGYIDFPNLESGLTKIVELESLNALQKIKAIIEDDSLSDFECVEEIVCVLEDMGSNGGNRHDFG